MKISNFFVKIFGSKNDRIIKKMYKNVEKINILEKNIECLSNSKLQNKTNEFYERLNKGELLNDLLPEAFAVVREASKRIFNMRHFDVQLIGGMILNNGCIAEMKTGEGKTLTSTLPAYLNALKKNGVHIVTVNDYLAKRDSNFSKLLFEFLGLKVGLNLSGMSIKDKKIAYNSDITYGTNNEYGFDYLRDNMVFNEKDKVQRKLDYAILDEVDSILIDESRTPLIISGQSDDNSKIYIKINDLVCNLIKHYKNELKSFKNIKYFSIDEKSRQIYLTENGLIKIEKLLLKNNLIDKNETLYYSSNIILIHNIISSIKAHVLFRKNIDYIIKNNQILIIDEHTGRIMHGRRWSDGIHQAIEAKENVYIQNENQTLASITFQNYFRLYKKLSGMTGTADTEAYEFKTIYNLDTIVIPTNKPMIRKDYPDSIYITEKEKINAIVKDIKKCIERKQPVLIGTISIEKSEKISKILKKENIKHNILNAKFHSLEANIISEAGKSGSVTIATNMAGRGTDIILGGNIKKYFFKNKKINEKQKNKIKLTWKINHEKVINSGGLYIIGTERHESRRIDNQLRGRSGRQGDIGSSKFYLSMEDSLMRIFASDKISSIMRKLGIKEGQAIEHPWITKAIENAQKKVENHNFDIRKQLIEYDDVVNKQRQVIYNQRNIILYNNNLNEVIFNIRDDIFVKLIKKNIYIKKLSLKKKCDDLDKILKIDFNLNSEIYSNLICKKINNTLNKNIFYYLINLYDKTINLSNKKITNNYKKYILLSTLDNLWTDHLASIEYLQQGIHLIGYAQKDPTQEYKKESFLIFTALLEEYKYKVISLISKLYTNLK